MDLVNGTKTPRLDMFIISSFILTFWSIKGFFSWFSQPQSKNGVDSFGGLGATLVDSLDTLYIMGLNEQFQKARE